MLVSTLGKIAGYRIFNVVIIKIILLESGSVLFCVFHISFGARSYGKIVRLFNLSTGEKNSGLTPGIVNINYAPDAVVTHQTWMLFLASSMRENVWKKDRSSQVQIPSTLIIVYLVFSADQNGQFDRFERFCVPLADLFPGLSSFVVNHFCYETSKSLHSLCLARYYNVLIGKQVNVTIWQRKGLQTCRSA